MKIYKYEETPRPHPDSSRIARFRAADLAVTDTTPLAKAVFQARLSANSTDTCDPVRLILPPGSSTMALLQMGGWKNRDPVLTYYDLETGTNYDDFPTETVVPVGLNSVAYRGAVDPERKLLYIADEDRIKSYKYGLGGNNAEFIAKHTMASSGEGPIALMDRGGMLLRAGSGQIEVWNVDSQPTHGAEGDRRIGKGKYSTEGSWRDNECDEIEDSNGSKPTSVIQLQSKCSISDWAPAPSGEDGKMLVSPDGRDGQRLWSMDVNAGGVPTSRYLGHSGTITQISTSPADDPNSFLTACRDGVVRLYDVREPLPKLSFDVGCSGEPVTSALYVHVQGVPGKLTLSSI